MHPEEKVDRLEAVYNRAVLNMTRAYTVDQYKSAAELFSDIAGYKDADVLAEECRKTAEEKLRNAGEERKNRVCNDIRQKMAEDAVPEYRDALILLKMVPDWEEAAVREAECNRRIEELLAKEAAEKAENERLAELARQKAERIAKRKKQIKVTVCAVLTLVVTSALIWKYVIDPAIRYRDALAYLDANDVVPGYEMLVALEDYKDSATIAASVFDVYMVEKLKVAVAGDSVFFGTYEQDGITMNGKEYVEWLVLESTEEKMLVVSKYALDRQPYYTVWEEVTWEMSTLRKWLNEDFMNAAFSAEEQEDILTVTVTAEANPEYETDPGNDTQDKVFLLSISEARKYFKTNAERRCEPTKYTLKQGIRAKEKEGCEWWLRTPGFGPRIVSSVFGNGKVFVGGGTSMSERLAVRPALWIVRNT